jgi:NADH dehydrogenase
VDVRVGTSVTAATADRVTLSDGAVIATHTLIWTAGVTPNPLIAAIGLPSDHGRLVVDATLRVPGRSDVFALGDAAAVPDLTRGEGALTGQTAQHAQRQGKTAARNVAASLGFGRPRAYRHRDLGFVVDLGGVSAVANPLHVPISGFPAAAVTRGYHLLALPSTGKRVRVAADWLFDAALAPQLVQLGFVPDSDWSVHATEVAEQLPLEWHRAARDLPRRSVQLGDSAWHAAAEAHAGGVRGAAMSPGRVS